MTTKQIHTCRICSAEFTDRTAWAIHATGSHDIRRNKGNEKLPLRTVSCWRCAEQIDVNHTNICNCGFVYPHPNF